MKKIFLNIMLCALLVALICELSIFLLGSHLLEDGLSVPEIASLSILTPLIFLLINAILGTILLYGFYKANWKKIDVPRWGIIFLIYVISISIFSYLIDSVFYVFDNELSSTYGKFIIDQSIKSGLSMGDLNEQEEYVNLPFIIQNWTGCLIGLIIGSLISFILARTLIKSRLSSKT